MRCIYQCREGGQYHPLALIKKMNKVKVSIHIKNSQGKEKKIKTLFFDTFKQADDYVKDLEMWIDVKEAETGKEYYSQELITIQGSLID